MSEEKKEELGKEEQSKITEEVNVAAEDTVDKGDVDQEQIVYETVNLSKDEEESTLEMEEKIHETDEDDMAKVQENGVKDASSETVSSTRKINPVYIGLFALLVVVAIIWKSGSLSFMDSKTNMPIAYAKEDALYLYDLKNEPYKVTEKLSDGGNYHYYYSAWGVECSEDAKVLYYCSHVQADGTFQLYRRGVDSTAGDGTLIGEHVIDYKVSKNGDACVYLTQDAQGKTNLYSYNGEKVLISEDIPLVQDAYFLSSDGKFVAYRKQVDQQTVNFYAKTIGKEGETLLGESLENTAYAKEADRVYFVISKGGSYSIYVYAFGGKAILIADKATAMELLANGKDLLYCTQTDTKIKCSDVIIDDTVQDNTDKTQQSKAVTADKNKTSKEIKNPLYAALKDQKWDSPMQNCYIWSDGKVIEVAKEVLNATVVQDESGYVLYSTIDVSSVNPVKISQIQSEEEARYIYFSSLSAAPRLTYLVKPGNTAAPVEKTNIDSQGFLVSSNKDKVAFQEIDAQTGNTKLFSATLGSNGTLSDYQEIAAGTQNASYTGKGGTLFYMTDFSGAMGRLNTFSNGETKSVSEKVSGFSVADDLDIAYFISNTNELTGNGTLQFVENGVVTDIDTEVFCMQYKGNGNLVYIKNYNIESGKGDLYYWNGKESKKLDEGITSIFIY